jgi:hypothetical protein
LTEKSQDPETKEKRIKVAGETMIGNDKKWNRYSLSEWAGRTEKKHEVRPGQEFLGAHLAQYWSSWGSGNIPVVESLETR